MAIEKFDDLIGTWVPAGSNATGERELFHFSPLGHFVMEWGRRRADHVQICELSLTEDGFTFWNRESGTGTELGAMRDGGRLVLVPPHGERIVLRRVVEEMEAEDANFFVQEEGE